MRLLLMIALTAAGIAGVHHFHQPLPPHQEGRTSRSDPPAQVTPREIKLQSGAGRGIPKPTSTSRRTRFPRSLGVRGAQCLS